MPDNISSLCRVPVLEHNHWLLDTISSWRPLPNQSLEHHHLVYLYLVLYHHHYASYLRKDWNIKTRYWVSFCRVTVNIFWSLCSNLNNMCVLYILFLITIVECNECSWLHIDCFLKAWFKLTNPSFVSQVSTQYSNFAE